MVIIKEICIALLIKLSILTLKNYVLDSCNNQLEPRIANNACAHSHLLLPIALLPINKFILK